jgi:hypothetical protein
MTDCYSRDFESLTSVLYFWSGTSILIIAVYWIFGGIYTLLDITNKPAVLRRYKIQPGTNEPVDSKRLMKASIHCFYIRPFFYFKTNVISVKTSARSFTNF